MQTRIRYSENPVVARRVFSILAILVVCAAPAGAVDHMFGVPYLPDDPAARSTGLRSLVWTPKREPSFWESRTRPRSTSTPTYAITTTNSGPMWSFRIRPRGLGKEQIVRYATSADGLTWSAAGEMMAPDTNGMRFHLSRVLGARRTTPGSGLVRRSRRVFRR